MYRFLDFISKVNVRNDYSLLDPRTEINKWLKSGKINGFVLVLKGFLFLLWLGQLFLLMFDLGKY